MTNRSVAVFGPAYLDRVLRVDRPLFEPGSGPPSDQSVDGVWKFGTSGTVNLVDPSGYTLEITVPDDWPGPTGEIQLSRPLRSGIEGRRAMRGLQWRDDLGGMGAGYTAALRGTLSSVLGPESDPTSQAIAGWLARLGVVHYPIRAPDHPADWTLLITSGEFGDKLPIGFRGCHAAVGAHSFDALAAQPCDLRVVASMPNAVAAHILRAPGARVRLFAPAMRNMLDRDCPISSFAAAIDVLCCNRVEWETLEDREAAGWLVSILVVTDVLRAVQCGSQPPPEIRASCVFRHFRATARRKTRIARAKPTRRRSSIRCSTRTGSPALAWSRST